MTITRTWTADPADPSRFDAQTAGPLRVISAVIRLDVDGIYVHTNSTHYSLGVDALEVTAAGRLKITHPRAGMCAHVAATGDESITATRGIVIGASGGGGTTELALYDSKLGRNLDLNSDADYARVAGPYSNLWFMVLQIAEPEVAA